MSGRAKHVAGVIGAAAAVAVSLLMSACGGTGAIAVPSRSHLPRPSAAAPASSQPATAPASSPGRQASTSARPLAGMVIGIDPGHNGLNYADPSYISQLIWNGREEETCDTTGTQTDGGYTEARFNFDVAMSLRADLRRDGARVAMTRASDDGVGPCVNRRSQIINRARADVAIDIHADGAPASGRGFAVLEPVADGPNDKVITASERFGADVRSALLTHTTMLVSTYDGVNGITHRDDLAGLNLTSVPKVLIECGNMRNATDAALLISPAFQKQIAKALEAAIIRFLRSR